MKSILKYLIFLLLFVVSFGLSAHQPDLSSTLLVEKEKDKWILQIRSALTAFEYEIENHFGKSAYATPEEFQELVLKHLLENIAIAFNDVNIGLQNGMVKLGHETSVTYEVSGVPENIQSLMVQNSSFKNLSRNKSALIVMKKGFEKNQFIMQNDNNHTVNLKVNESKFEQMDAVVQNTSNTIFSNNIFWILSISFVALAIVFFFNKKRRVEG